MRTHTKPQKVDLWWEEAGNGIINIHLPFQTVRKSNTATKNSLHHLNIVSHLYPHICMVVWWLAHNKKVPGLNLGSGLSVWSLHVLPIQAWIYDRYSSSLTC